MGGDPSVVRDEDDRRALGAHGIDQQVHDVLAGERVERAGRLIGEQHLRSRHQRPADGDALGLPPLPTIPLALVRANNNATPLTDRLAGIMLESISNVHAAWEQVK